MSVELVPFATFPLYPPRADVKADIGGVAVDCASDRFAVTTLTNAAMIRMTERKGNSFQI
jgi:hypothetical protein